MTTAIGMMIAGAVVNTLGAYFQMTERRSLGRSGLLFLTGGLLYLGAGLLLIR